MSLKKFKPVTPGLRSKIGIVREDGQKNPAGKALIGVFRRSKGRSSGSVTVRHKGGGAKRLYRFVDFKRDKVGVTGRVSSIEYDPNRGSPIALISYRDGGYRYILCPSGLKIGDFVETSENAPIRIGNTLPLRAIPLGTLVHNIEIYPGRGGQLVRGAGTAAQIVTREEGGIYVQVKLPSGEIRRIIGACFATIGQLGNADHKNINLGKAGASRHLGRRPTVRGVAQDPRSHPHGGGEGKSGIGLKYPKTPWGRKALGKITRRRTLTDKYIVQRRGR